MRQLALALAVVSAGCTLTLDPNSVAGPPVEADLRDYYGNRYDALVAGYGNAYDAAPGYVPASLNIWDRAAYVDHYTHLYLGAQSLFSRSHADDCVSDIRGAGTPFAFSQAQNDPGRACRNVWQGQLAQGATCALSAECALHDYCKLPTGSCSGTCTARAQLGESCATVTCDYGLTCMSGSGTCESALLDVNAPCGATYGSCRTGLSCLLPAGASATVCTSPTPVGGDCSNTAATFCGTGTSCLNGKCVKRVSVGGSCTSGAPCVFGATCVSGACVAPVEVGGGCSTSLGCKDGLCVNGVCQLPGADGTACASTAPACMFTTCNSGTCQSSCP
jgi:hypothetical protein